MNTFQKSLAYLNAMSHQNLLKSSYVSNTAIGLGALGGASLYPVGSILTEGESAYKGKEGELLLETSLVGGGLAAVGFGGKALGTMYAKGFMRNYNKSSFRDARKGVTKVPSPSEVGAQFLNSKNFKQEKLVDNDKARDFARKYVESSYFSTNKNEFYNLAQQRYSQ